MKKTITSLASLKEEKKKLKREIEWSKREFEHSLGNNRANLKDFLVKKVVIPAGIAGVGMAGVNKLMSSNNNENTPHHSSSLLSIALPILGTLVKTYFLKNVADENRN